MMLRPVALRKRPELVLAAEGRQTDGSWIVEDPVAMKYFRLRDEEWFILQLLNGERGFQELRRRFEQEFNPVKLGKEQLNRFLFHLHELGLVVASAPGQGKILLQREERQRRRQWLSALSNPLAITLPGIPARRAVNALYGSLQWLFHPAWFVIGAIGILFALLLVVFEFALFQQRLPNFQQFFSPQMAIWFACALVLTKTLHELGHALMSRHFGGSCREIGIMLLVFVPTLYCDVSDSWRIRSRWQRIAISAAGMYVDWLVAACATCVWWFSGEGVLNAIALRVMFICSVSTLLFNANPLVRCDGYYILSDLVGIPNLWQESRSLCTQWLQRWSSGQPLQLRHHHHASMVMPMILYAISSMIYCTVLILGILWLAVKVLEPQGFSLIAWILCAVALYGLLLRPLQGIVRTLWRPSQPSRIQRKRWWFTSLATVGVLVGLFTIPAPDHVYAPVALELRDPSPLYAEVSGTVLKAEVEGARVERGATIVELANADIEITLQDLQAEIERRKSHIQNIKKMLAEDQSLSPLLPAETKALDAVEHQLKIWEHDRARLTIQSPRSGVVVSPPRSHPQLNAQTTLPRWLGTPLESQNVGAVLEVADVIAYVAEPGAYEASVWVEQTEASKLHVGQKVRVRLEADARQIIHGKVKGISKAEADQLTWSQIQLFDLPTRNQNTAKPELASVYYQAKVELEQSVQPLLPGMHGQAKISVEAEPLGPRLLRTIRRTFWF